MVRKQQVLAALAIFFGSTVMRAGGEQWEMLLKVAKSMQGTEVIKQIYDAVEEAPDAADDDVVHIGDFGAQYAAAGEEVADSKVQLPMADARQVHRHYQMFSNIVSREGMVDDDALEQVCELAESDAVADDQAVHVGVGKAEVANEGEQVADAPIKVNNVQACILCMAYRNRD